MKVRGLVSLVAVGMVAIWGLKASAHAPNAIKASYDLSRGELNVIVEHLVNDPWQHYVKEVLVLKAGREVLKKEFDFQTSHRNLTVPPMKLGATEGDELRILARCSEGGQYETAIKVGGPAVRPQQGPIEHDIEK